MGIYDREYYRQDGPRLFPSGSVCRWLIVINLLVFVMQIVTRPHGIPRLEMPQDPQQMEQFVENVVRARWSQGFVTDWFALESSKVLYGQVWRLITYGFLHSTGDFQSTWWFAHILFNMLGIWFFGSELEEIYGSLEFLVFYLAAVLTGGLLYFIWETAFARHSICIGASGGVMALLVLYACHFPHREIYFMYFFPIPIWLAAVFYMAQDALAFLTNDMMRTHIAVLVHLGGGGLAFFYHRYRLNFTSMLPDLAQWWRASSRRRAARRFKLYQEEDDVPDIRLPSVSAPPAKPDADEHLEAKLDAVLEKVAKFGKASLDEAETKILLQASEHYKKRRN